MANLLKIAAQVPGEDQQVSPGAERLQGQLRSQDIGALAGQFGGAAGGAALGHRLGGSPGKAMGGALLGMLGGGMAGSMAGGAVHRQRNPEAYQQLDERNQAIQNGDSDEELLDNASNAALDVMGGEVGSGQAGAMMGMVPGAAAGAGIGQLFKRPGVGGFAGAVGGGAIGAALGRERYRQNNPEVYENMENSVQALADDNLRKQAETYLMGLQKLADMDPEEQALHDQYDQAEQNWFDLRRSIPDDIHADQNKVRRKETMLGTLGGASIGAGIGGVLGAASGKIPHVTPRIGRTALSLSIPGAMIGSLVGDAKGNKRADQILLEQNPELHGQLQGAMQSVDDADDALTNYYFPQKEAETYLTGLKKMASLQEG